MGFRDIRYAVRSLVHDAGVSTVVILCLSLGIGVNATLFGLVDGILIQPLPYVEPERLFILNQSFERGGIRDAGVSYQDLRDLEERSTMFAQMAGLGGRTIALSDQGEAERFQGAAITWDMFQILGVQPLLGRHLRADDDRPGAEPVVMLSYEIWQRRYQGDPNIIGRSVTVNGKPHTVAGVMPVGFSFPENQKIWIPLGPTAATEPRTSRYLFTFARLRDGVDIAQARAELQSISSALAIAYPTTNDGWNTTATTLSDEFVPDDVRLVLFTMMGAVTLVLLIACANVANLMLARSSGRQREFCVRAALGAGRLQLIKQLLLECVLLGLAAAPLGLAIAYYGVYLLDNAIPPDDVPYYIHWEVSPRVIAYTIALSAATGLVFGLAPALQAGRLNLQETLRDGARGSGQSGRRARVRNGLVILEVAMALILLVGASLFVRSFLNMRSASPGFETAPLLTTRFFMTGDSYATREQRAQRVEDIMRRIESLPGVVSAFASNFVPLDAGGVSGKAMVDGRTYPKNEEPTILLTSVTPHLYKTMNLPLLKGRDFTDGEGAGSTPVAVINETMAKKLWPDKEAVGGRFRFIDNDSADEWFTVIGVAPDIRMFDMDDDTPDFSVAYVPYRFGSFANIGITIRAASDPVGLAAAVRREIRASDPGLPIFNLRTMEDLRQAGFWQFRLFGYMFGIFGVVALFLAGVGVYGVLSFSVSQRTQEMGVRIALGASRADVLGLVVKQGVTLAAVGVVLGLIGAFGITRVIQSLLYNVRPTDPISFGGVALFLAAIAVLASYLPARRATNVDPIIALRNE